MCHCQQGQTSSTTLCTLSPKKQASPIKIGTNTLKEEDEATYLGVTFDKRLPWKPHTLRTEGKARKKLTIMHKLAGTACGANEQILKTVRGISETRPRVQLNSMVYNCKDQPTIPRQDSKPGTTHHYQRNEVHTHYIHGANHRYTTSTAETTSKGPSLSREMQVPPRSSHEGEGRGPYQEQNKEKQFHT